MGRLVTCAERMLLAVVWLGLAGAREAPARDIAVPADHPTIQQAIDRAEPGDNVLVSPGTYRETVRLKPRVMLRSVGDDARGRQGLARAEKTLIEAAGAAATEPALTLAEGSLVDGFTITGVGLFDQKEFDKHSATRGEELPNERGAAGLDFPAVSLPGVSATLRHCIVRDNGHLGIGCTATATAPNRSRLDRNVAFRNMGSGIGIADGAQPLVEGNVCFQNLRGGIGNRKSAGLLLNNECYENVRAGIGIREGATPIVKGNRCHHNRRAGIGVRMAETAPLIVDNDCYANGMAGIGARDHAAPLIRRNRCYENELAGIGTSDGACSEIVGNVCYRNKEAGIGTELGAKVLIADNECYENEAAGIGQRGDSETILTGNHVHHNKKTGIGFDETQRGRSLVARNRLVDNALVAVGVHSGWKVKFVDNVMSREGGLPPLVMVFKNAEAELVDNQLTGSGVAAVRTEGKVRLVGNMLRSPAVRPQGPPQFGVWALPGADVTLIDNSFRGYRQMLGGDKATVVVTRNTVRDVPLPAIRLTNALPRCVFIGNVFETESDAPAISITGEPALLEDNRQVKPK